MKRNEEKAVKAIDFEDDGTMLYWCDGEKDCKTASPKDVYPGCFRNGGVCSKTSDLRHAISTEEFKERFGHD